MTYDIIGDVHGQVGKLKALLDKLDYVNEAGTYRHPEGRMALFLGDLIDRGSGQLETIHIVRRMIDAGAARSVMGNHEWNAIGYATPCPDGSDYLRKRSPNKRKQHAAFLAEVGEDSELHRDIVAWFKTLPPFLDLGEIRVCHAWWDPDRVALVAENCEADGALKEDFLVSAFSKHSDAWAAIEGLTKGLEVDLPDGHSFIDHTGITRENTRLAWWNSEATTFRSAAMVPEWERPKIPDLPLPADTPMGVASDVPVFIGHYWLSGKPGVLSPKAACLDYGAGLTGPLVAYRWDDGESVLSNEKFLSSE